MRQPTKEGPVSRILDTVSVSVSIKLECHSCESIGAAGGLERIPVQVLSGVACADHRRQLDSLGKAFTCATLLVEGCRSFEHVAAFFPISFSHTEHILEETIVAQCALAVGHA